jgi:hypothetical protein
LKIIGKSAVTNHAQAANAMPLESPVVDFPPITPGPPMSLAEALRAADNRNLTLAVAKTEIEKAEALLKQAWATLFPGFFGQVAYTYNEPSIWYEFVYETSAMANSEKLANILVTNGFINIEPLEMEFKRPVITSNQATIWAALRRIGLMDKIEGFGRLLRVS